MAGPKPLIMKRLLLLLLLLLLRWVVLIACYKTRIGYIIYISAQSIEVVVI
jgi:hypothetical protein